MDRRVNKFISDSGYCSRREADRLVEQGAVTVNGAVAQMGVRIVEGDQVKVNGRLIKTKVKRVYIALNKPVGVVSTTDPAEPNNIADFVGYPTRIFNIGRLDKPSDGLILLTNDGDIVNKVLRAANNHEKEYIVTVDKPISESFLKRMSSGVPILGTVTLPCKIKTMDKFTFRIVLTQGLNRQIRRMCEYLGYEVIKLKRVRIMNIHLGSLGRGQWRLLTSEEMTTLNRSLESSDGSENASHIETKPARRAERPHTKEARGDKPFSKEGRAERPYKKEGRANKPFSKDSRGDKPFSKEGRTQRAKRGRGGR